MALDVQTRAGYLFCHEFQQAYLRDGPQCCVQFELEGAPASPIQVKKDTAALYGALKASCRKAGKDIIARHTKTMDGLKAWIQLEAKYGHIGHKV